MALIVVGGQTKDIGKTTLICNIIEAFPRLRWTAVKITNHLHAPEDCEVVKKSAGWMICNQNSTQDQSDTTKFLRSGAARALLVQAKESYLEEACAFLRLELASAAAVIVESASAAECLAYDLLLLLLDPSRLDFKQSARQQLESADAFIIRSTNVEVPEGMSLPTKPRFAAPSNHLDPALLSLLEAKLESKV